jgi:cobalt-zinc-cadmium resistance protein CzcA
MRINEMVAGIRTDLGVKLYGESLETLKTTAAEIERVLKSIPGAADTTTEQITGLPVLKVRVDNEALSRYGIPAESVLDVVKAAGGITVGEVIEPSRRFPLVVRLPLSYREDPHALETIFIPTPTGQRLPLSLLARIEETEGPSTIQRDFGERRIIVQTNVRGRDIASFVKEAQGRIDREVKRPTGYTIEWGGQFEHLERAEKRLYIVVPLALSLILSLLYLTFRSLRDALMIFSGVLFALILVSAIRDRMARGVPKREAIEQARLSRLRPVLMTGTVAALGFVPMMLSTGIGAEVQKPLATVVVFGMACDTFLTMLALPVLYLLFGKGPRVEASEEDEETLRRAASGQPRLEEALA